MNADFLRRIRFTLSQELVALTAGSKASIPERSHPAQAGADLLDQAQAQTEQNLSRRFSDRNNRYVQKVRDALARLDLGVFGVCESCGSEIPLKRLLARPTAIFCVACQNEQETLERQGLRPRLAILAPSS